MQKPNIQLESFLSLCKFIRFVNKEQQLTESVFIFDSTWNILSLIFVYIRLKPIFFHLDSDTEYAMRAVIAIQVVPCDDSM